MWLDNKLITLKCASDVDPTELNQQSGKGIRIKWGRVTEVHSKTYGSAICWWPWELFSDSMKTIFLAILTISGRRLLFGKWWIWRWIFMHMWVYCLGDEKVSGRRRKLWVISFQIVLETTGVFKSFLGERWHAVRDRLKQGINGGN